MDNAPQVGRWAQGGPAQLSSWLVVLVAPTGLAAAAGTLAVKLDGTAAWVNIDGGTTWERFGSSTADLAAHIALTGTAVHGLGTASTHAETDFVAASEKGAVSGVAQLGADRVLLPDQHPLSVLARTMYTVAGSGTHTCNARARMAWVEVIGGGGAGGGAVGGVSGCAVGGGGGGAGATRKLFVLGGVLDIAYVVGAGGTGVSGAAGNAGAASTATHNGVAITSGGGSGGSAGTNGTTPVLVSAGGSGVGSGGDENFAGATGAQGVRIDSFAAFGGSGGNTLFAMGAGFNNSGADGISGYGPGAGGSGGHATTVDRAGGPGYRGRVYIWEFS